MIAISDSLRRRLTVAGDAYLDSGLTVMPARGKAPWLGLDADGRAEGWDRYKHERMDPVLFRELMRDPRVTGLIMPTGYASRTRVYDFDCASDGTTKYEDFYRAMLATDAAAILRTLPITRSGGGGYHIALPTENVGASQLLAAKDLPAPDPGQKQVKVMIETRGTGGLIMLAPSLHASGGYYTAVRGSFRSLLTLPRSTPEIRDLFDSTARSFDRRVRKTRSYQASRPHGYDVASSDIIVRSYNQEHTISDVLSRYGYAPTPGGRFRRPGGESGSVVVDASTNRSFHHSSSEGDIADGYWKTPFDLLKHWAYGGNFVAAKRHAAESLGMHWEHPRTQVQAPPNTVSSIPAVVRSARVIITDCPDCHATLARTGDEVVIVASSLTPDEISRVRSATRGREVVVVFADGDLGYGATWATNLAARLVRFPGALSDVVDRLVRDWSTTVQDASVPAPRKPFLQGGR